MRYTHVKIAILTIFLGWSLCIEARLPDLIPYRKGNLWGYCDSTKKMVIEPQWERVDFFRNGRAVVWITGKSGIIDSLGHYVITPQYKYLFVLGRTRYEATNEDGVGVIDDSNKVIVPFTARFIMQEGDSVINAVVGYKANVYDLNGNRIFQGEYLGWDYGFGDAGKHGLFIVIDYKEWKRGFWGLGGSDARMRVIDRNEKQLFPGKYEWISVVGDSLFECETDDSICYYNFKGQLVQLRDVEMRLIQKEKFNAPYTLPLPMEWIYIRDESGDLQHVFLGYKSERGVQYWEE